FEQPLDAREPLLHLDQLGGGALLLGHGALLRHGGLADQLLVLGLARQRRARSVGGEDLPHEDGQDDRPKSQYTHPERHPPHLLGVHYVSPFVSPSLPSACPPLSVRAARAMLSGVRCSTNGSTS